MLLPVRFAIVGRVPLALRKVLRTCAGLLFVAALVQGLAGALHAEDGTTRFTDEIQPILVDYCYGCHSGGSKKGSVSFDDRKSTEELLGDRKLWLSALKNVRLGIMPPLGKPRPTAEEVGRLAAWIKRDVFDIDPADLDPGRVTVRRLNRVEYRNTIRDLLGVDFRTEEEFPPDDTGYGFDTIGDVLSVSPLLFEKYLQAAETIVAKAVPTTSRVLPRRVLRGTSFKSGSGKDPRLVFDQPGSLSRSFTVDADGDYRLVVETHIGGGFDFDPARCEVEFKLDGGAFRRETYAWHDSKSFRYELKRGLKKGDHRLVVDLKPVKGDKKKRHDIYFRVSAIEIEGPLDPRLWSRPPGYERIFTRGEPPADVAGRKSYARAILESFASRAYRRPVDPGTLLRLIGVYERVASSPGRSFEEGVGRAMVAVLASPRFLFRVESPAASPAKGSRYVPLDEYSLASRLSYFLWSTMPDATLFNLASKGELRAHLAEQVDRMTRDSRFDMLVRNFVGQWLESRDAESVSINPRVVLRRDGLRARVDLDEQLRKSMRREPEMLFAHVARENLSLLDLLDSDYTFLNARLARHYGIKGIDHAEMRKVALPKDSPRGGVLTQSSFLMVTSNPTRTSPVKRGQFILENLLGAPAPPPPPDIPPLEAAVADGKGRELTTRELMAIHRAKPLCASCHARMDPLGLAFENFNALGMFRQTEQEKPIDASGKLITGESFRDVRELKRILKEKHRLDYYRCVAEKLFVYALGRGLDYADVETIDRVVERLDRDQGRFRSLLLGVVESAPFQKMRRVVTPAEARAKAGQTTRAQARGNS